MQSLILSNISERPVKTCWIKTGMFVAAAVWGGQRGGHVRVFGEGAWHNA